MVGGVLDFGLDDPREFYLNRDIGLGDKLTKDKGRRMKDKGMREMSERSD